MRAICIFPDRSTTESALKKLKDSGFSMDKVSVIAKYSDSSDKFPDIDVTEKEGKSGSTTGAATGAAVGTLGGLLAGISALTVPGIGPIITAGTVASALGTTLIGTGVGAGTGGLIGALMDLGIPDEKANTYSDRISRGDCIVIVEGRDEDIHRAESILSHEGTQDWNSYNG
ncbi:DUF1269 domain-containing protein [Nostoc sp. UHCC 0702]|nr:DUF1269 domain-containing protein [Nostoc sp. UHCC 0702]